MRILVCNWKDPAHPAAGGAEVYTHEVTRRWAAAGHEVTWFAAAVPGMPTEDELDGVRVMRGGSRLGVYAAARRFHRGSGDAFDLVIDEVNTKPFGCAHWRTRARVVALVHQVCREIWFHETPLPVALAGRYLLEPRWLRAYRDLPVLTVSDSSRTSLAAHGLRDVRVVPEGISVRQRPPVAKNHLPTLVFVGRLTGSKRPADAVKALTLLRQKMPDAQLWIVGDGPRRHKLAADGVRVFGRVSAAARDELVARAHALVVTSVREGWALVVDEAAAMGTPSVGYDVPGLRDSIPAASGVLVEAHPGALADALEQRLPSWMRTPPVAGWPGGAVGWDVVAEQVLNAAMAERGPCDRSAALTGVIGGGA